MCSLITQSNRLNLVRYGEAYCLELHDNVRYSHAVLSIPLFSHLKVYYIVLKEKFESEEKDLH